MADNGTGLDDVQKIKERLDIVELVSESVRLKRTGQNYKGLCPFHKDTDPSFYVSPARQTWHCFSCNEGGDIFSFVMKMDGLAFPEALRVLAQRAGVVLSSRTRRTQQDNRTRIRDVLERAAQFYHTILVDTQVGVEAFRYLKQRGISRDVIDAFLVGFAPEGGEVLLNALRKAGFAPAEGLRAGVLATKAGGGVIDRFRNRIVFPIHDTHGSVVGFGGRILREDPARPLPKYINTPETEVYHKHRVLYGLAAARAEIHKDEWALIVEGYFDVLAAYQAGVRNVVACAGTALTEQHVALLKRFASRLAFAFDADSAGLTAARRAIDVAIAAGCEVEIVAFPPGKDAADVAKEDAEKFRRMVREERKPAVSFFIERAMEEANPQTETGRRQVMQATFPLLRLVPSAVVRGGYLRELAEYLEVGTEEIYLDFNQFLQQQTSLSSPPPLSEKKESESVPPSPSVVEKRWERFAALVLFSPALWNACPRDFVERYRPPQPWCELLEKHKQWWEEGKAKETPEEFFACFPSALASRARSLLEGVRVEFEGGRLKNLAQELVELWRGIARDALRRELEQLRKKLALTKEKGAASLLQQAAQLTREISELERPLDKIKRRG